MNDITLIKNKKYVAKLFKNSCKQYVVQLYYCYGENAELLEDIFVLNSLEEHAAIAETQKILKALVFSRDSQYQAIQSLIKQHFPKLIWEEVESNSLFSAKASIGFINVEIIKKIDSTWYAKVLTPLDIDIAIFNEDNILPVLQKIKQWLNLQRTIFINAISDD